MSQTKNEMLREFEDDLEMLERIRISAQREHEKAYTKTIDTALNNGGNTDYYNLPFWAKNIQDLIEFKEMNFAQGNIIKAIYRCNDDTHSEYERELNKIIWFANRELERLKRGE